MADRRVIRNRKDADGDITPLCNPEAWWSPRHKWDAIGDIEPLPPTPKPGQRYRIADRTKNQSGRGR